MPIGSIMEGGKQKKAMRRMAAAQEQSNKIGQARANAEAHRERIRLQREARIRRAQVISGAANAGVGLEGSGVVGATGSITSQLGQGIGTLGQMQSFSEMLGEQNQLFANAQFKLQKSQMAESMWNQIGSTALQLAGAAAGAAGGPAAAAAVSAGGSAISSATSFSGIGGAGVR